jgi:hypothetical protein
VRQAETTDPTVPSWYRRPASAALDGLVTDIVGYGENGHGLAGEVEMASLVAPLIISFGDPFSIALGRAPSSNDRWSSFAAGLYLGPVVMDSTGAAACVQVNFTPQGAHRFFGFPMTELAARMVALDDLGDRDILRLPEQLGAEPDWERRLDITERFVAARLHRSRGADAAVSWACRHVLASRGTVRMSRIARELGWSRSIWAPASIASSASRRSRSPASRASRMFWPRPAANVLQSGPISRSPADTPTRRT